MNDAVRQPVLEAAFLLGGEMGALIRAHEWSATPFGPVETWPQPLRVALGICLGARAPMGIYWGEQLLLLYNDAFGDLIGDKHPQGLGRPAGEIFPEIWDTIGPMLAHVRSTGEATGSHGERLPLFVQGKLEDRWFDYTFNPILGDGGQVEGILVLAVETTDRVLAERARLEGERRLTEVVRAAGLSSDFRALFEAAPIPLLVLAPPDWTIVAANDARLQVIGATRMEVIERQLFEAYPDDPDDPGSTGVQNLSASLQRVLATRTTDVMAVQRYAVRDPSGRFVERWWSPMNTPVLGQDGEVALVIHRVEEVTDLVRLRGEAVATDQLARDQQAVIDRLRATEAERRAERELLGEIFEQAPGFMAMLQGPEHRFTLTNAAYRTLIGGRNVVGRTVREALPEVEGQGFFELLDTVYTSGKPFRGTATPVRLARRPGHPLEERFVDFVYQPVLGLNEQVTGIFVEGSDVTEAHGAQSALRESEARFRLMADASPQIVWITDRHGRMEFFNRKFTDYTGEPGREATPAEIAAEFMHPEDGAGVVAAFEAALRRGEFFEVEHRIRSAAGDYRWFLARAEPYCDPETGEITRWVGASVDIHSRRQAEAALRESEARLRELNADLERQVTERTLSRSRTWQLSPEIMGVLNRDAYFEQSNPAWKTVLGWSEAEVAGTVFFDLVHPDDLSKTRAAWTAAIERGEPALDFENRYRTKDGSWRWLSWVAVPDNGKVYCSARDITVQKGQEAELGERTAERDRMWVTSPDLMLVIGFDGVFRRVNPAWTSILGYTPEELVGHHVNEFVVADDHEATVDAYELAAEGGQPRIVNRYRAKDGSLRWISWTAAPAGDLTYAMGRDITAEKEREAELEQAQEALRQSQKLDAMGQLTGGVAHDFNNLLTPIIASLDMLLRRGVGSERERRLMDGALQSAERAKVLVQRLLAFARKQPLQPGPVDVRRLVGEMAELIASTSGPRIDVRVELPGDLPPALADTNQLEMAVLNLAVNARDAMPDAGVLTISAARESVRGRHPAKLRPGHYVCLSVADTGVGMDEATLARAVEPFFSTKGIGKGTGLGLSMVHGLAEQLGGGLTIASRPGQGTTVSLWLPLSAVAAEEEDGQAHGTARSPEARGTALLADDEDLVRLSTADMLMDLGYEVVEAQSADEALRLVDEGLAPDLVVTDHLMPGMSGLDLARNLRSHRPDLPILIISGYAEMDGIAPGFTRLTKPFRAAELAASLAALAPETET